MKINTLLSLNKKVYNQCILPVLAYGSEAWSFTKVLEQKLLSAQRGIERIMLGIAWIDRKRASWIREQTKIEDILATLKRKVNMSCDKKVIAGLLE